MSDARPFDSEEEQHRYRTMAECAKDHADQAGTNETRRSFTILAAMWTRLAERAEAEEPDFSMPPRDAAGDSHDGHSDI